MVAKRPPAVKAFPAKPENNAGLRKKRTLRLFWSGSGFPYGICVFPKKQVLWSMHPIFGGFKSVRTGGVRIRRGTASKSCPLFVAIRKPKESEGNMGLHCPKCKDVSLEAPAAESGRPYICKSCGGMWLTKTEIERFTETGETGFFSASDSTDCAPNLDERAGLCPSGHGLLTRARIDADPHFYLERCSRCGGVWFDCGEWDRLVETHLLDRLPEFWTSAWQRAQRSATHESTFREIQKKRFGEAVFADLVRMANRLREHPLKGEALAFLREEIFIRRS